MGLIHRKLLDVATNPVLNQFCLSCSSHGCTGDCFSLCPDVCNSNPPSIPPPSIPSSLDQQSDKSPKISPFLIATIILVAAAFLVVCCYAFYSRYYLRRRQSAPRRQNETPAHEDFLDEDESPVIDHPIWYIRTVGLQPSIISSITVCKYKRGEGIVEGAECSVCLSEFQEDETLRLLPKCSHAFHLPCIDTWLRSHTNCPMCRAPIVKSTVQSPSPELNVDNSGQSEETQVGNSQSGGGSSRELVDEVCELRIGIEEEAESTVENSDEVTDIQPMRRSVSMDSLSASKISLAMAKILPGVDSNKRIGSKRVDGNQNSMRISSGSSSKGRSLPNGLPPIRRSFSGTCGTVFRSF